MENIKNKKQKEYCISIPVELILYVKAENETEVREKYANMTDDDIKDQCDMSDLPCPDDVIVEEC